MPIILSGLKTIPRGSKGLGAITVQDAYNLARQAGFDEQHAKTMVAIAQRESGLNPSAACINCAKRPDGSVIKESSVGLWQINTNDSSVWARVKAATGITSPEQLKDPSINAQAAYALWNGNDSNLNTAWQINNFSSPFGYGQKYQANLNNLPSTIVLEGGYGEEEPEGSTATSSTGFTWPDWFTGSSDASNSLEPSGSEGLAIDSSTLMIAAGIGLAALLFLRKS